MRTYYTYKTTFPGMPWYYYGYHKDNGKPYFGSPVTHKRIWDMYECEVQILEWFENIYEAQIAESRIIRHFLNDPNCLNEHCGGFISLEARRRGGKTNGKRTAELKIGCHSPDIPRGGIHHPMNGKSHREDSKQKMSEARTGERNHFYGKTHTTDAKQAIGKKTKERMNTLSSKQHHSEKMKGRSWWTSPEGKTRLAFEAPGEGWVKGRG